MFGGRSIEFTIVNIETKSSANRKITVNPLSWSKSDSGGFTMFPVEIKREVLSKFLQGTSISKLMKDYHIKGSATIYQWYEHFKMFGVAGLSNASKKTYYDYSFKIKVIKWRQFHQASYPVTARHFKLKNPVMIWDWERKLIAGRLNPKGSGSSKMTDKTPKNKTIKQLQTENELLRVRVAYLEKLKALAQKKSPTKKKPS